MDNIPYTNTAAERAKQQREYLDSLNAELAALAGTSGDQSHRAGRLGDFIDGLMDLIPDGQIDELMGSKFKGLLWVMREQVRIIELLQLIEAQQAHLAKQAA